MTITHSSADKIVDVIFKVLIDGSKQDYIGEKISQLEHSLQAASFALDASKSNQCVYDILLIIFFYMQMQMKKLF